MYQPREYRAWVRGRDLAAYTVRLRETDLYIRTSTDLSAEAFAIVKKHREALESRLTPSSPPLSSLWKLNRMLRAS